MQKGDFKEEDANVVDSIELKVREIYDKAYPPTEPVRNPRVAARVLKEKYRLLVEEDLVTLVYSAFLEGLPVLFEGPPGTGKTEIGEALLTLWSGRKAFVLPCSENYDEYRVIGDFHPLKAYRQGFNEESFIPRPLLAAMILDAGVLIDEIRRSSEEFQNMLLDIVDKRRIIVPELRKVYVARGIGFQVIFTSNPEDIAQRELSDAFLRRVVRVRFSYPPPEKEIEILKLRLESPPVKISEEYFIKGVRAVNELRKMDLIYKPGTSDVVRWIELSTKIALLRGKKEIDRADILDAAKASLIKRSDEERIVLEVISSYF
uniref:MoxR family ATPase n=1 Tax=Fervidicoccus fontis TaxID=683846 RepID=A0A7J3ZMN5_9CREN